MAAAQPLYNSLVAGMPFFTTDIPCPSCGYNRCGLSLAHRCRKCGLKVVSDQLTPSEQLETKRLDAEIEENLRKMEEEKARQQEIAALLASWALRGQRFDHLLDRIEKVLDRLGGTGE